ncbi:metal-sensitive transcriptional regulator [Thermomicrobium sp. 4228-Ro]|uniref:metal-sensitive transcriptional regulator n=1 Tax=Thermomicrobium sp. 4228-Ro TaxID=2993937 RepID=UPI0022499FBC|nr:metal-sensitive transcriptional regulator [Thermomicrobium sp. 4228-Ro]MCX2726765.1 metal-sensitive transcriptional regulator [Thermomicrobium sp. 4228-Ro]
MTSIAQLDEMTRTDLLERLRRIEGQARGIARMIEEGRECVDVVQQLVAMRAATDSLCAELVQAMLERCFLDGTPPAPQQLARVLKAVMRGGR